MVHRRIELQQLLQKKSVLLLGPRGTGKSFYIRNQLKDHHTINLLRSDVYLKLQQNPEQLEDIVQAHPRKLIVIDEIQKIPQLLDEVHRLIEEQKIRFLLTGSSARKLKASSVNLLAGRAWLAKMFPFSSEELGLDFSLDRALKYGTLPAIWLSGDPREELDAYVQTYIESELKAEGIIRKVPAFSRFLKTAALMSGELLNFQNVSSDAAVPASTVKEHYKILEDTLVGHCLEPWLDSKKRKAISTGKFYFFDIGVLNFLSGVFPESESSPVYGNRFEHFIVNEVLCANSYLRAKKDLRFWRSTSNFEVDLIFGDTAIEIKSTTRVSPKHLNGLKALMDEKRMKKYVLVSRDKTEAKSNGIHCLHYKDFLRLLWDGKI